MAPRRPPLGVWLYGRRIAELTPKRVGQLACRYTDEALDAWPGNIPLLSCSLPLARRPTNANVYFRGMLPERQHLLALATEANVPTSDTYGLLARFGRDVAGAAVIAVDDPGPRPGSVRVYRANELEAEVANLEDRPLAVYDDSELSIAGLQNRLLLVRTDDGWARPIGGRPSTHILKVEDRRYPGLVEMEAACLRLAHDVGLTNVEAETATFAGMSCLIVSRFDRIVTAAGVDRIHQEDACQALGRDYEAQRGKGKYQDAGGPKLVEIAELLDRYAREPLVELERLVAVATFNTVIGNADAHGKNISLLYEAPGVVKLAPLYDTVPTALWPQLPTRAAMYVNGRNNLADVTLDDVIAEARHWSLDSQVARRAAATTGEHVRDAATQLDIPDDLRRLVRDRAATFLRDRS
jgi:serine/threonine-protein kinase HipA